MNSGIYKKSHRPVSMDGQQLYNPSNRSIILPPPTRMWQPPTSPGRQPTSQAAPGRRPLPFAPRRRLLPSGRPPSDRLASIQAVTGMIQAPPGMQPLPTLERPLPTLEPTPAGPTLPAIPGMERRTPPSPPPFSPAVQRPTPTTLDPAPPTQPLERPSNTAPTLAVLRYVPLNDNALRQLPGWGIDDLWVKLYSIQLFEKFIPAEVSHKIDETMGRFTRRRWFEQFAEELTPEQEKATRRPTTVKEFAMEEFHILRGIQTAARDCFGRPITDASWHLDVHRPLIMHATAGFRRREAVSAARGDFAITAPIVTDNGQRLEQGLRRPLDTAIIMHHGDQLVDRHIWEAVKGISNDLQVGGHPTQFRGPWIYAYSPPRRFDNGRFETLLLIMVTGHYWKLMFVVDQGEGRADVVGDLPIGDTLSIVGIYRIVASLRVIAKYADGQVVST